MGVLASLSGIAILAFGLVAGVWVDRLRRRPILIGADLGRAALLSTIPLAAMAHVLGLAQLFVVAALTGILTIFFDVAYQTYVPSLVGRDELVQANTRLTMSSTIAEIAGPGVTGVLVQAITAPVAILFDAVSFLVSAAAVLLIRTPEARPVRPVEQHVWTESLAGLRFIRDHSILRPLGMRALVFWLSIGPMGSLYMLYATRVLQLKPALLGLIIAMGGIGATLGTLVAARIGRRLGVGATLIGSAVMAALGSALIPLAQGPPQVAAAFLMVQQLIGDFGWAVYFIHETSLRQAITPEHVLGRVNAAMQLLSRGVLPFGALLGGLLGQWIGVRPTLALSASGVALSLAWLIWSPVRELDTLAGFTTSAQST